MPTNTYVNKNLPKKLKVTQSITPDLNWTLITESNKQLLEKVRFEGNIHIEDQELCGELHPIDEELEKDIITNLYKHKVNV